MVKVEHWNWLLIKSNVNVETNSRKKHEKQTLKILMSTTIFGYVFNGKKNKFQLWM